MNTLKVVATAALMMAVLSGNPLRAQTADAPVAGDAFYQDLGGKDGVRKFVDDLIPLLLADERINKSFKGVDMKRLSLLLQEQFCQLSGGGCVYTGKSMKLMHDGLNITNAQFNALAEDLQVAMDKNNVPSRAQNKLLAKLAPMQRDVVTK